MKPETQDFYNRVWDVVSLIPPGRVTSYGAIAKFLGAGRSSRMVGYAMNASHFASSTVPAQRVVNRNGMLSGKHHFSGSNTMQELLEQEGIEIVEDCVVDFAEIFWDPAKELQSF